MFKPYTIRCVTCGAQLSVQREVAIGQILACPHCHSMVHVEPPAGDQPATESTTAIQSTRVTPGSVRSTEGEDDRALRGLAVSDVPNQAHLCKTQSTAEIEELPKPPLTEIPRWIVFPAAASVGAFFVLGIWVAFRPHESPPTPPPPSQERSHGLSEIKIAEPVAQTATKIPADPAQRAPLVAQAPETPIVRSTQPEKSTTNHAEENRNQILAPNQPPLPLEQKPADTPQPDEPTPSEPRLPLPPVEAALKARLDSQLDGLQFQQASLTSVLSVLAEWSAIPIVIDRVALWRTGLSPTSPVSYHGEGGTIQDILDRLLRPLGLIAVATEDKLIVTMPDIKNQTLEEISYDLRPQSNGKAIAEILQTVIYPPSWQEQGGGGTIRAETDQLHIKQTPAIHGAIRYFLTRLDSFMSDGQQKQTGPATEELPLAAESKPLEQIINCGTRQPMPLTDYLRQLASRTEFLIILDELELLRSGTSPEQLLEVPDEKQSLGDLFRNILTPLGLAAFPLDARTILVTCHPHVEPPLRVEFYTLPAKAVDREEELLSSVRQKLAPESWHAQGGAGRILFDRSSKTLIVLQTPGIQREVARYLQRLGDRSS